MAVNGDIADIGFKKGGYLFIVPPRGVATLARNFERQKQHKVNVEWLAPDALKERFPSRCGWMISALPSNRIMTAGSILTPCSWLLAQGEVARRRVDR